MAITAPTTTGQFSGFLRPDQAAPYFVEATRASVVQQLVRQVPIGINGAEVPVNLGKLTAAWTAEAGKKPASQGALGLYSWRAYKIASIAVVSAEVVRANPGGYMNDLRPQIGEAFGIAFDQAVLHGINSPFGTNQNLAAATKTVELGTAAQAAGGLFADFNGAIKQVVQDVSGGTRKKLTGFVLDTVIEPVLNGAVDTTGRPLFIPAPYDGLPPTVTGGRLIGRPTRMSEYVALDSAFTAPGLSTAPVGYAADWSQMVWGLTGGISYDISSQATVTINGALVSLWENNLLAVRAEAEYGFMMKPGTTTDGGQTISNPGGFGGALASVVKIMNVT